VAAAAESRGSDSSRIQHFGDFAGKKTDLGRIYLYFLPKLLLQDLRKTHEFKHFCTHSSADEINKHPRKD